MKCNDLYFNALAGTFERKYNVNFVGLKVLTSRFHAIHCLQDGCPATERDRLIQFKQNVDIALSVLDQSGLGDWIVDRLLGNQFYSWCFAPYCHQKPLVNFLR